ncbi:unnamed protein product [Ambrosiozyma monospora]|uniref:Unnamed protein product n=1 Tax=Ambrosiozyma monospora TaxID=43982 RepID=A0ACB5U263_AMBMO|nr:unnamed protein product [Ambrosiozyma monospora]
MMGESWTMEMTSILCCGFSQLRASVNSLYFTLVLWSDGLRLESGGKVVRPGIDKSLRYLKVGADIHGCLALKEDTNHKILILSHDKQDGVSLVKSTKDRYADHVWESGETFKVVVHGIWGLYK